MVVYATRSPLLKDGKAKTTDVISAICVNQLSKVFIELQNCITLVITNDGVCAKIPMKQD